MRICVTGRMASGKTTVARCMGQELEHEVFSLEGLVRRAAERGDQEARDVLEDNWRLADQEFYSRLLRELTLYGPANWILDGAPLSSQQLKELPDAHVVALDCPRRKRIRRLRTLARPVAYGVREQFEYLIEEVAEHPMTVIVDASRPGPRLAHRVIEHLKAIEKGERSRGAQLPDETEHTEHAEGV